MFSAFFYIYITFISSRILSRFQNLKFLWRFLFENNVCIVAKDYRGETSPCFILKKKRVGLKRNVARWIELFHATVVVLLRTDVLEATDGSKGEWWGGGEGEGETRNKRRITGWSIPPATAYAFIIIHEIPKRRFRGLSSALRTGSKRLIERGGGEWGREAEEEGSLSWYEEKIYRRNKNKMSLPSYE